MLKWQFENFIYAPTGLNSKMGSYAQLPTPLKLSNDIFRIYFSSRDDSGQSRPFFLDYNMAHRKVVQVNESPVLELGAPGCFDDCGIMPSSIVEIEGKLYMYYIGWNQRRNISYQLAIGLAISEDGGDSFKKYSDGPILDRNPHDPIFCAAPCVHHDNGEFKMWYISCTGWPNSNGRPEPVYLVKYATSKNGIAWNTSADVCIPYNYSGEAIGRPWVFQHNDQLHMLYSSRGSEDYRNNSGQHYQVGYAKSCNGINWNRLDSEFTLKNSKSHWDSEMQEYTAIIEHHDCFYMLYNGNKFGQTGIGLAKLILSES